MRFVPTADRKFWINLNFIESLAVYEGHDVDHFLAILQNDSSHRVRREDLAEIACKIHLCASWEMLSFLEDAPEEEKICVEPLTAWAINPFGKIFPVTPSNLDSPCAHDTYALRQRGNDCIFLSDGRTYENEQKWRESMGNGEGIE